MAQTTIDTDEYKLLPSPQRARRGFLHEVFVPHPYACFWPVAIRGMSAIPTLLETPSTLIAEADGLREEPTQSRLMS